MTVISATVLMSATLIELPKKLVYNGSSSSRIGFYWIDEGPIELGDFVLIYAPENARELIETRHYLPPNVPLIKRVVGIGGDEICRHGRNISVNGIGMGVAKSEDLFGRPLPVWQGCRTLDAGRIFVLNFHPDSFDGRYFGPIDRSLIIGRATWIGRLAFF
ncbi:S26 family signal peptidase [Mariluticola halotolerans]|uniref:S26 family signal peptidase n=1 Tax=Mariluticola halotolerans TaxID=2909283 RepID=UPI0026E43442|nr:S26 family signal peptidase [Mariluticola halotolerans]UJQ94135.1 S26 family signal peptidase [Mariluticola halotolerans]